MNYIAPICVALSCLSGIVSTEGTVPEWDLLIFTQSWPLTVCREWKEKDESHGCQLPLNKDTWTIHGIWPTKLGTIGPGFCNKTWHFDPQKIKPIENNLNKIWVNVEKGTSRYSFWSHEWLKHGTCAAVLPQLDTELKYFSQGLDWMQNVSMTSILENSGISPSNDKGYKVKDIFMAVKKQTGTNPVIECHKAKGKEYISELRICFDKSLQLVDCDGVKLNNVREVKINDDSILTNCDTESGIIYSHDLGDFEEVNDFYSYNLVQFYYLINWVEWLTFL